MAIMSKNKSKPVEDSNKETGNNETLAEAAVREEAEAQEAEKTAKKERAEAEEAEKALQAQALEKVEKATLLAPEKRKGKIMLTSPKHSLYCPYSKIRFPKGQNIEVKLKDMTNWILCQMQANLIKEVELTADEDDS